MLQPYTHFLIIAAIHFSRSHCGFFLHCYAHLLYGSIIALHDGAHGSGFSVNPPGVTPSLSCQGVLGCDRRNAGPAVLPPATIILHVSTPELSWFSLWSDQSDDPRQNFNVADTAHRRLQTRPNCRPKRYVICVERTESCYATYHVDSKPLTPVGLSAKVVIRKPCRSPSCGLCTL